MLQHNFGRSLNSNFVNGSGQIIYSHPQFYYIPQWELADIKDNASDTNVSILGECPRLTKEDLDLYDKVVAFNVKHFPLSWT